MLEKDLILLVSLPFVSIIVVTLLNFAQNPYGTIHGIYKFQRSLYDKIFQSLSRGGKVSV